MKPRILALLLLPAFMGACGGQAPASPGPQHQPAATSAGLPRGWLPLDQRRVKDLITLGGPAPLRTQADGIPTFVAGAEVGRIHVIQKTLMPEKPKPTELSISRCQEGETAQECAAARRAEAIVIGRDNKGRQLMGSYDVDWSGIDVAGKQLPGGTYIVKLRRVGNYLVHGVLPGESVLAYALIGIADLSISVDVNESGKSDTATLPTI